MTNYLAFSIGDGSTATTLSLPGQVNAIVNDPNIVAHFFRGLFSTLLVVAILLALGFFIFFGFQYMISEGDKKEIEKARSALINTLVGLILAFFAFFIVYLFGYFFKVPLLNLPF